HAEIGHDDVRWLLAELGSYVAQGTDAGAVVYKVADEHLAGHLRPPFPASPDQPFDLRALPIAAALLGRYQALLAANAPACESDSLRQPASCYAAMAGPAGLGLLRQLAGDAPEMWHHVANAAQTISQELIHCGRAAEALGYIEEAARLRQHQAAADAAF